MNRLFFFAIILSLPILSNAGTGEKSTTRATAEGACKYARISARSAASSKALSECGNNKHYHLHACTYKKKKDGRVKATVRYQTCK